ncbi:MAG: hypothetical protein H5T61_16135 [Thermoflexales bacterium]|nr:hypothetical protein [Thermoflexales bacterium]
MAVIEKVYEGGDLVIPRLLLLELGVKPGEVVLIRPKSENRPAESERATHRLVEVLDALYGAWTEEDEAAFEHTRKEIWAGWRLPNWS